MQTMLGNKKIIFLFLFPGMLIFTVFYLLPIFFTAALSFTDWNGVQLSSISFSGVGNFVEAFTSQVFWKGIINTMIILLVQMGVQIPTTVALAIALDHCTKGLRFFKTSFFIPYVLSATAVALLWARVYDVDFGLINGIFSTLHINFRQMWLSKPNTVLGALLLPIVWRSIGYYLIILYAGVKSIPKELTEAAMIDGCSPLQSAIKIKVPLLHNVINVVVILAAVGALREYPLIYVMTGGGPFNASTTPAILMYTESFLKMGFGYGSAVSVLLILECLIVSAVINKLFPSKDLQF
jgi:raffinose/stachyose/melibiose transport system permease protein